LRPKDEEDRHRAKREQYARWREQRKLQKENDRKAKEQKETTTP
jgi:hypothetical protein